MKHIRKISLAIILLFVCSVLCTPIFAAENGTEPYVDTSAQGGCRTLNASASYLGTKMITGNIKTAIVFETNSETLMYALNPDEQIEPSSLVKILTALIAVEKGNVDDQVTATQETLDAVPDYAVTVDIAVGEIMSLSDLLYCMMVGSGNDAAAIIAAHISGDQESFVQEMNDYAKKLGCTGTQFTNVHGIHDEQQFSTTRDMARIVTAAVKNEKFMTYFSAVHYDVPATNKSEVRKLSSGNFLINKEGVAIYYDERVHGGRTGIADDGLRCLASVSSHDNMELVCVITGSESSYTEEGYTVTYGGFLETTALLNAAFEGYRVIQILHEDQILQQCKISNGANDVVLGCPTSLYSVLPVDATIDDLSYRYKDPSLQFQAPIEIGQNMTCVEIWYGDLCIGQADLVAMNSVAAVSNQPTDDDSIGSRTTTTVIVILVIVGAAVLVFLFVKFSGRIQACITKKNQSKHRRNHRRTR